jgi:hypothetical protein
MVALEVGSAETCGEAMGSGVTVRIVLPFLSSKTIPCLSVEEPCLLDRLRGFGGFRLWDTISAGISRSEGFILLFQPTAQLAQPGRRSGSGACSREPHGLSVCDVRCVEPVRGLCVGRQTGDRSRTGLRACCKLMNRSDWTEGLCLWRRQRKKSSSNLQQLTPAYMSTKVPDSGRLRTNGMQRRLAQEQGLSEGMGLLEVVEVQCCWAVRSGVVRSTVI